jgi:hypothetical protein
MDLEHFLAKRVQGFAWDDFHKGEMLMQRGMRACEDVLPEIKTLVQ